MGSWLGAAEADEQGKKIANRHANRFAMAGGHPGVLFLLQGKAVDGVFGQTQLLGGLLDSVLPA